MVDLATILARDKLTASLSHLAERLHERRERTAQAIARSIAALEHRDAVDVAFDLAGAGREIRLVGVLLQLSPSDQRELLALHAGLIPSQIDSVLELVSTVAAQPRLVKGLAWVHPSWFTTEVGTVFISYSHADEIWKDRLVKHLAVLEREDLLAVWDDRKIRAGVAWHEEIKAAIARARVAVMLVSANFLASEFIVHEEVPSLLERRWGEGLRIFPVILRPCAWKKVSWLSPLNIRPRDAQPLSGGDEHQIDSDLTEIAEEIHALLQDSVESPGAAASSATSGDSPAASKSPEVSIGRLPITGTELFGRDDERARLDRAWADPHTHVLSLVAWGGVGKSALVNHWLAKMAADGYRGAGQVFGWSFYSQGARHGTASADRFVDVALRWLGDPDPSAGLPWDKGARLAKLVRAQRTLLVIDGLEPLQEPPGPEEGQIKDRAMRALLRELAAQNPGLCLITTRLQVRDLDASVGQTVQRLSLEHLSAAAGARLLDSLGVQGTAAELEEAARAFGGHALALTLVGSLIRDAYQNDVRRYREVGPLAVNADQGGHARRVMERYSQWLGEGAALDVLHLLGLFDRPAAADTIAALREPPAIDGLTDRLVGLDEPAWRQVLSRLRRAHLLADEDPETPGEVDAHPLVREHFGEHLRQDHPDAWRAAHSRLFEHLKATAKDLPDTIDEMAPLYAAVKHGCHAGHHQEALDEVYRRRIQRGKEHYNWKMLGAFGADLAVLRGFFDRPWSRPVAGLKEADHAFVLNEAGCDLRALCRLSEAAEPLRASLEAYLSREYWMNASISAHNLSDLNLALGDLAQALALAEQGVELADRSGYDIERMETRAILAAALHQAGQLAEAATVFGEAEDIQKKQQPQYPILYSVRGYLYCDLLLGLGQHREVLERAGQTLKWATRQRWLLGIALDHLSLGRALVHQARQEGTGDLGPATGHLDQAVQGLRDAGTQDQLPLVLLARAALRRELGDLDRARTDLDEALTIASRSGMRLHEADARLEQTRLHLALNENAQAAETLAAARQIIEQTGYHRRDPDLADLEESRDPDVHQSFRDTFHHSSEKPRGAKAREKPL